MKKLKIGILILVLIVTVTYLIPVQNKHFDTLYSGDKNIATSLADFRKQPLKSIAVEGVNWTYLEVGQGDEYLVFLHGMGGAYDIWWQEIEKLKATYRIISLTLPAVNSLEAASNGISTILEAEGISKFNMIGSSMGGYIAQYYAQKYPEKINRLIVGNSFPPNDTFKKENGSMRKMLPYIPAWIIMKIFRGNLKEKVVPASEQSPLVEAYLLEQYYGLMSKAQFIGRFDIVLEYFEPKISPAFKAIPKLLIEADNDPLISPILQKEIKALYPEAEIYTFNGKGHFEYLNAPNEYTEVLRNFLGNKEKKALRSVIQSYFNGRKKAELSLLRQVFHPSARLTTQGEENNLQIISLSQYFKVVETQGAQECKTTLLALAIDGDMATAHTSFQYPKITYNDYLTLYKLNGEWKIINKTFLKKIGPI